MLPEITAPPGTDVRRDFQLFAALTKAYTKKSLVDGVETDQMYLSGIASSTARDRHGDTITARAQAMMLDKITGGNGGRALAMFLNHDYNVPEDVLGVCGESQLLASKDAEGGDVIDLEIVCRVTGENPRAVMAWKIVKDGVPLGFSIGGAITECEVDEENDDGASWCPPLIIDGLDLMEISLCGIPANPRSYTDAAKALVKDLGLRENAPEPTKDWARIMRLGFVRGATRNADVREKLREALPALRAKALPPAPELVTLACTECDWKRDGVPAADADELVKEHEDDQAHLVERSAIAPAATTVKTESDDDSAQLPPAAQSKVAEAIGSLSSAISHGMCADSLEHAKKAHDALMGLLAPGESDPADPADPDGDGVPDDLDPDDRSKALKEIEALIAARTAEAEAIAVQVAEKGVELVRIGETIDQRSAETAAQVAAEEAKLAELRAEAEQLQKTIDEVKTSSTGRATSTAGASGNGGSSTLHEAKSRLAAALSGNGQANPAQRPA